MPRNYRSTRVPVVRRAICCLSLFAMLLLVFSGSAAGSCITPKRVEFAHGPSPTGEDWTASATVRKNGDSCDEWLFGVEFTIPGAYNWGSATGIPAGGHTYRYFTISAFNYPVPAASVGVVGGYVGREVTTIKMQTSDGRWLEVKPVFPPIELRRRLVWMRSFRYFVLYYPGQSRVESIRLFNRAGTLIYRDLHADGELF
jgi:hypothetical protein